MGMQISCGVHTEISAQGAVSAVAAGVGAGVSGFGRAEGMQSGRGTFDARSRAHAVVGAAEVFGIERDGVYQGQECDPPCAGVRWQAKELRRPAFLGTWVLGIDRRQKRGCRPSIYPGTGERRPTPRTTGDDGGLSASR